MISSKNWVSRPGVVRHYGISRAVEIVRVYGRRSRMRRLAVKREEAEVVRSPAGKRYRVEVAKRVCEDCSTRRTPLWRKGPSGPRTLCNACGIRYRRRTRRLQANCGRIKCENSSSSSATSTEEGLSYEELKQRQKEKQMKMLLLLDWTNKNNKDKVNKIQNNPIKMGATSTVEDEEAALLLLSLSSAILLR